MIGNWYMSGPGGGYPAMDFHLSIKEARLITSCLDDRNVHWYERSGWSKYGGSGNNLTTPLYMQSVDFLLDLIPEEYTNFRERLHDHKQKLNILRDYLTQEGAYFK